MTEEIEKLELSDEDRAEMQSHYPYAGLQLNELSTQEERLVHFFLRGMSKAAAGRAAGYGDAEYVYKIFKKPKIQKNQSLFHAKLQLVMALQTNLVLLLYTEVL